MRKKLCKIACFCLRIRSGGRRQAAGDRLQSGSHYVFEPCVTDWVMANNLIIMNYAEDRKSVV